MLSKVGTPFKVLVLFLTLSSKAFSQDSSITQQLNPDSYRDSAISKNDSLTPYPPYSQKKVIGVTAFTVAAYGFTMYTLNKYWYADFPRSSFHFFDDFGEWEHIDKAGHFVTSYTAGKWAIEVLKWTGTKEKKAVIIGGLFGSLFLTTIETLDGFSEKWGASPADLTVNTLGSVAVIAQELKWKEQRIIPKFSYHPVRYSSDVIERAFNLYGQDHVQRGLKDYNGQTYWLSVNPNSFLKQSKIPSYLNIAVGYGAEKMLGGYDNRWTEDGIAINRNDIERYKQFYLSLDLNWEKIQTEKRSLKYLFVFMNLFKFPFPALEYNTLGQLKGHWIYF